MSWHLSQVFGGDKTAEEINDADIVSSLELDKSGNCLAAGDRGGRLVLFHRDENKDEHGRMKSEYKFYSEFQSHEAEFDRLKSLEIEGKINKIKFLPSQNSSTLMLTTNDKTIKLWKVFEKTFLNTDYDDNDTSTISRCKMVYKNAHTYSINSISVSSDMESFLSADELAVNLWNFGVDDTCMTMVDLRQDSDEISEVITCADFHGVNPSMFLYGSSKGITRIGDLRVSPLCDNSACTLDFLDSKDRSSIFYEIISSICDAKFLPNKNQVITRDFLSVKIWDLAMTKHPVEVIPIHDHLRSVLGDLYESETIFDKFDCAINATGSKIATGSYHRYLHILDYENFTLEEPKRTILQANRLQPKPVRRRNSSADEDEEEPTGRTIYEETNPDLMDFGKKVLNVCLHPTDNICFASVLNNLYIFTCK